MSSQIPSAGSSPSGSSTSVLNDGERSAVQAIEALCLARDDRLLASQRAAVDSAKLVSTFVLALAGTLVGTALQVSPRAGGELAALILTAASLLCVLTVVLLDQLDIPTFEKVTANSHTVRLEKMQLVVDMVITSNERTTRIVRAFALISVGMSAAAGVVSGVALMLK